MISFAAIVVSVLPLLSLIHAFPVITRQDPCSFVCPVDITGNIPLSVSDGTAFSCSYTGYSCTYHTYTGTLVNPNGVCPERATQQCSSRRNRVLKQAVVRRGLLDGHPNKRGPAPNPSATWKRQGSPSPYPKRLVPSPTWHKRSDSWPEPTPPPSKPGSQPPTKEPITYRCPQQDLAKDGLTGVAIRFSALYCNYSKPECKTCSFCKYSTVTGLLLEDNDGGNCPQTATLVRLWDSRHI